MNTAILGFNFKRSSITSGNTPIIPPQQQFVVCNMVQIPFRATKLVIPYEISKKFSISDIKIVNQSVFANMGNISAECFAVHGDDIEKLTDILYDKGVVSLKIEKSAISFDLRLPIACPGSLIAILGVNDSDSESDFRAMMIGETEGA